MFEESLVTATLEATASRTRWFAASSMFLQCSVAAVLLAVPLLHPEPMELAPHRLLTPLPLAPAKPVPPPPRPLPGVSATAASAMSVPRLSPTAPKIPPGARVAADLTPPVEDGLPSLRIADSGDPVGQLLGAGSGSMHRISVASAVTASRPTRVSFGVAAGMLLAPIRPSYPAIAALAHVEGAVVISAVISSTGSIEQAQVVSGPALLRQAALAAVVSARYRPYRLNGVPTEVQTTITINFRLGAS